VSLSQRVGVRWHLDAAGWARRGTDVNDPNVFFGTTVTVPNSVARQKAYGFDLRADMEPWRGFTFGASYSHARVVQFGPITGGLFLEDNFLDIQDGTKFIPDHDQRHALSTAFGYGPDEQRWRVTGAFRYRTGTPVELDDEELDTIGDRAGGDTVDVEAGRVRPQVVTDMQAHWRLVTRPRLAVTAIVWVDNIFNASYAFNFGNPFSGTHFGAPRRMGVTIRLTK
jgi:outer membrane receptor protein involved in Fe transport